MLNYVCRLVAKAQGHFIGQVRNHNAVIDAPVFDRVIHPPKSRRPCIP
jgi:hypothetical protein